MICILLISLKANSLELWAIYIMNCTKRLLVLLNSVVLPRLTKGTAMGLKTTMLDVCAHDLFVHHSNEQKICDRRRELMCPKHMKD